MISSVLQHAVIVPRATQVAIGTRRAAIGTGILFCVVLGFYAMLLPATNTGGVVGLASLRFLTLGEFLLAVMMAAILALTVTLGTYGLRHGSGMRSTGSVLGAIIAVIPVLFCCSPILPLAIATLASVLPAAGQFGLPIQGFLATHEGDIYGIAIVLMLWGLYANARRTLYCSC